MMLCNTQDNAGRLKRDNDGTRWIDVVVHNASVQDAR